MKKIIFLIAFLYIPIFADRCFDGGECLPLKHSGMSVDDDFVDNIQPIENMNFDQIRSCFPIFSNNDNRLIYFDCAATAQMPQSVIDAIVDYYAEYKSNVGRGLYDLAQRATQAFEQARIKIARFIGADKHEIVFTSGATASINLVLHIWAQQHIKAGDEIVISEVEHNANFIPWYQLASQVGAMLIRVPVDQNGLVQPEILKKYISNKTKLVALTHQSNILGTINDVEALCKVAHSVGAKFLVDAAQSVAHCAIDVAKIDCDFLVFSGHKIFGPTGVGVLYIKESLFQECEPCNFGGGMVYGVSLEEIEFKEMPHVLEPGTQPIAQVIGLGAAVDFMKKNINYQQAAEHESSLAAYLIQELDQFDKVHIVSARPTDTLDVSMVTFYIDGVDAYDVAQYLNEQNIAVRAGYHCCQPYHDAIQADHTVRVSFSVCSSFDEVKILVDSLKNFFSQDLN